MKQRRSQTAELQEHREAAYAKARMWGDRADKARLSGRRADAERCDDKVRDWASKARQIERSQDSDPS